MIKTDSSWLTRLENIIVISMFILVIDYAISYWKWFKSGLDEDTHKTEQKSLFPDISNVDTLPETQEVVDDSEYESEDGKVFSPISATPCSTGLTTRLLPFKNDEGEIEWAFTEDKEMFGLYENQQHLTLQPEHSLSPTVSNSSNNESIISNHKKIVQDEENEEDEDGSPLTSHSSPFTPDEKKMALDDDLDGEKMHQCPHCEASFKIRGYLTRHLKKHAVKKAYSCPFHEFSVYIDENNIKHKCHPSGGFSRRDTYKTHLKSRHFKYPKGTKTKERLSTLGLCSMCGENFPNAEIWCELHVEGGECSYLPSGFKGKSRIKNRLKKQLSKQQQRELEQSGALFSKQFSMAAAVAAAQLAQVPQDQEQTESHTEHQTHDLQQFHQTHDSHQSHHSHPHPTSHAQPQEQFSALAEEIESPFSSVQYEYHNVSASPSGSINSATNLEATSPVINTPANHLYNNNMYKRSGSFNKEEYDDEFCLDIDQLNNATFNNFNEIINYMKFESQSYYQGPTQQPPQPEHQPSQQSQQQTSQQLQTGFAQPFPVENQYAGQFVNQLAIYN